MYIFGHIQTKKVNKQLTNIENKTNQHKEKNKQTNDEIFTN
jgi:hypothetical protein